MKTLIVPDVHGRNFWKEPVNKSLLDDDCHIVFLGDYLDPYYDDFFNEDDEPIFENLKSMRAVMDNSLEMFKEIIELKKSNMDKITLLLGNHDCGYAISPNISDNRMDKFRYREISNLFMDNKDLFQLAYEVYINDVHYIFSHAGINKEYAKYCFEDEVNESNVVELFNNAYKNDIYGILMSLGFYSYLRGCGGKYGSIVWADAREWFTSFGDYKNEAYGFSIVGHTQLTNHRIIDNYAFLDSRECFILDEKNQITPYK